jgi:hypothetical protein
MMSLSFVPIKIVENLYVDGSNFSNKFVYNFFHKTLWPSKMVWGKHGDDSKYINFFIKFFK